MIGKILVLIMLIFSIVMLGIVFSKKSKFKSFYAATTIVYITGNILITFIVFLKPEMPMAFAIISECTILAVYAFSMYMIHKLVSSTVELQKAKELAEKKEIKENNHE